MHKNIYVPPFLAGYWSDGPISDGVTRVILSVFPVEQQFSLSLLMTLHRYGRSADRPWLFRPSADIVSRLVYCLPFLII